MIRIHFASIEPFVDRGGSCGCVRQHQQNNLVRVLIRQAVREAETQNRKLGDAAWKELHHAN